MRREAEQQVAEERAAELAQQAQTYEAQIQSLRADMQKETSHAVRERLMSLAGYRRPSNPQAEQDP